MNRELAAHVVERARLECALAPRVAKALGVPARLAGALALEIPPSLGADVDGDGHAHGHGRAYSPFRHRAAITVDTVLRDSVAPELRNFRRRFGVAVGKGSLAMAWGAGAVTAGICVTNAPAIDLPAGWTYFLSSHPHPSERSLEAARQVRTLVDDATDEDVVVALVSGGASAMLEEPRIPLDDLRAIAATLMSAGAPIDELNDVRSALSMIKGGQLALDCGARIITLVASDVIGDRLELVGSGPTIGPWLEDPHAPADVGAVAEARRLRGISVLERYAVTVPEVLRVPIDSRIVTRGDRVQLVAKLRDFADAMAKGLRHEGVNIRVLDEPMQGDVATVADRLISEPGPVLAWGEPTLRVPADHGDGGRMQQLALELARRMSGSRRTALAIGSDGMDGPPPRTGAWPAGAFVDGATWGTIIASGIDPDRALRRCDAGPALHAAGALVFTGPTLVNHADVVVVV